MVEEQPIDSLLKILNCKRDPQKAFLKLVQTLRVQSVAAQIAEDVKKPILISKAMRDNYREFPPKRF